MAFYKMPFNDGFDKEAYVDWFEVLKTSTCTFTPPLTWGSINSDVEVTCQRLGVENYTVTTAIDIYEAYARHVLTKDTEEGPESGLTMAVCAWIADKLVATRTECLTLADLQRYRERYLTEGTEDEVKAIEFEVYKVVKGQLPAVTPTEDAATVACYFTATMNLQEATIERCQLLYKVLRLTWRETYTALLWHFGDECQLHQLLERRVVWPTAFVVASVGLFSSAHMSEEVLPLCAATADIAPEHLWILSNTVFQLYVDSFHERVQAYHRRGGHLANYGPYTPLGEALLRARCSVCNAMDNDAPPGCRLWNIPLAEGLFA